MTREQNSIANDLRFSSPSSSDDGMRSIKEDREEHII